MNRRQPLLHQRNYSVPALIRPKRSDKPSALADRLDFDLYAPFHVPPGSEFSGFRPKRFALSDALRVVFGARIPSHSDSSLDTFVKVENSARGSGLTAKNESKDLLVSGKETIKMSSLDGSLCVRTWTENQQQLNRQRRVSFPVA